jgi:hypothetical protein
MGMEHWYNDNDRERMKYQEETFSTATMSTTDPTWTGLE